MPGEGSVFRRASDGAWLAQISRGPRGAVKTWSRSAATRSEALRKLVVLRVELERQSVMVRSTTPVGGYLVQWASDVRNIRPNTRRGYLVVIHEHLVPTIGHIPLSDLSPLHVERMLAQLEPTVSPKYLRNIHAVLRRGLNQAVRAGLVERNVAGRVYVDAPRVTAKDPEALSDVELDALLTAATGDRLEALFVVLADCGLRMGEALGLAWQDIHSGAIHVEKELAYRDGGYHRDNPKTDRSRRTVPLTDRASEAIAAHRERTIAAGFVPTATGPVFVNTTGGPLSGSWVTHHFYKLCAAAGIERRPAKILRATFSTRLYAAGVGDRTIADLMGHERVKTTQRHYISTTPLQAVEAVRRMA